MTYIGQNITFIMVKHWRNNSAWGQRGLCPGRARCHHAPLQWTELVSTWPARTGFPRWQQGHWLPIVSLLQRGSTGKGTSALRELPRPLLPAEGVFPAVLYLFVGTFHRETSWGARKRRRGPLRCPPALLRHQVARALVLFVQDCWFLPLATI